MIVKKYTLDGKTYDSVRAVRQALWDSRRLVIEVPKTAAGWARWGVTVEDVEVPDPEPDPTDLIAAMTRAVQFRLDVRAQDFGYDSCLSVCSYVDTGVAKFDREGDAFRAWRSAVWAKCYEILAEVEAGARPIPTQAELLDELPVLDLKEEDV